MRTTAKADYAGRAAVDLATVESEDPVTAERIAQAQARARGLGAGR